SDQGVFAGDVIGGQRHGEAVAGGGDYVQIRHGRLDHDHVGAFFDVEFNLAHGFAEVCGVHLIRAPIPELRRGVGSFAERSVEAGSEFGGVGKNRSVGETRLIESLADGGNPAVHHVG